MTLDELPIYNRTINRLRQSVVDKRIAHAQYFEVIDGAGGLALATAYAQEILAGEPDMFGGTDTRASRLEHPDLHVVFPMVQSVDKTCDSLVEELRINLRENPYLSYNHWLRARGEKNKRAIISKHEAESVSKKLNLRAYEGGHKVLLIWMAELMNQDCANKLLKLIEEPPSGSVILMIGSDASKLLPTIRSRVQVTRLAPLSTSEVAQALRLTCAGSEGELTKAAEAADGDIALAIDVLSEENHTQYEEIFTWLRLAYARKIPELMDWCDTQVSGGKEELTKLLISSSSVILTAFRKNYLSFESAEEIDTFTSRFAPFVHADNVESIMQLIDKAVHDIERNGNPRIVLLDTSFKLVRFIRTPKPQSIESLV